MWEGVHRILPFILPLLHDMYTVQVEGEGPFQQLIYSTGSLSVDGASLQTRSSFLTTVGHTLRLGILS